MKTAKKKSCAWCGEKLSSEELQAPRTDGDGDPICDECWDGEYTFECCLCCEYDHVDVQHYYFVVARPTQGWHGNVVPGIYYIKGGPYHGGSMFCGHLFDDKLLRLRDLPKHSRMERYKYPTGHLCRNCVHKLKLPETKEYRVACEKAND